MISIRKTFTLFLLSAAASLSAQTVNKSVSFTQTSHNFGTIEEADGTVSHQFQFKNVGKEPVAMLYVRPGCKCVTTEIPRQPIAPGQTATVTVSFDPTGRPGVFNKEIVIVSDRKQVNRLHIRGNVIPDKSTPKVVYPHQFGHNVTMDHKNIDFGTLRPGQKATRTLRFASECDIRINLDFRVEQPDAGTSVSSGYIIQPQGNGSVEISVAPPAGIKGPQNVTITPLANGYELSPLQITYNITK